MPSLKPDRLNSRPIPDVLKLPKGEPKSMMKPFTL
jgi:hypothetical protein